MQVLSIGDGANARSTQTVDCYGRMVAEVIGGVNINPALVEDGLAFAYRLRHGVWRGPSGTS
ncbi:MAG: thermonuclease family protein [Cyanobium sp. CZS 48M]|nr:thermonuclease family protein [Cyanobium sp. CZS48M]